MSKITYENKVALNQNPSIPDINKVNDTDMNMIKNVVNNNETKVLLAVSSSAPATCDTGDIYFNTTDNLIYTATATNTWGSTGVAPTKNTIYIEFTSQTAYAYDGTTLVSVGGGSGSEIVVGDEEPTEDTKMIIDTDAFDPQYSDITDEYSEANNKAYSCDYINNQLVNKQNGTWTLLQDNVSKNINVDLSNIDFNEIYVVIRNTSDNALVITQNVIKSDLTDTIKWYRNGYYYNAQVNSAVAVRASLTQIDFIDYYVNGSEANAKMTVYYR